MGAMVGALLGARHGWQAFPESWRRELEAADRLEATARAFLQVLQTVPRRNALSGTAEDL